MRQSSISPALTLAVCIGVLLSTARGFAGVTLDMPAPPVARTVAPVPTSTDDAPSADVGTGETSERASETGDERREGRMALTRYANGRTAPRATYSTAAGYHGRFRYGYRYGYGYGNGYGYGCWRGDRFGFGVGFGHGLFRAGRFHRGCRLRIHHGYSGTPHVFGGGYRISLSPFSLYRYRNWQGGYVH